MARTRGEHGSAAGLVVAVLSALVAVISLCVAGVAVFFDFYLNGTSASIGAASLSQDVGEECLHFQDWARSRVDEGLGLLHE